MRGGTGGLKACGMRWWEELGHHQGRKLIDFLCGSIGPGILGGFPVMAYKRVYRAGGGTEERNII